MGAFSYFPHTEEDIRIMLERIGVGKGVGALLDEFLRNVRIEVFHLLDADPVQHGLDIGVRMREIRESGHAYSPMWAL